MTAELKRRLERQAREIVQESYKEEGTHAAWMRGYALGLNEAARLIGQSETAAAIATFMTPKTASDEAKGE